MKKIIVTGFTRYGDYNLNASETVAEELHKKKLSGYVIHRMVYPCLIPETNRGWELLNLAKRMRASGIISLGMSSEAKGLRIETRAHNAIDTKYRGLLKNKIPIKRGMPYDKAARLQLEPWNLKLFRRRCVAAHVPVMKLSRDPGRFCCNHLMFQVKMAQLDDPSLAITPFIFIHIPCSPEAVVKKREFAESGKVFLPKEQVIEGLEILLRTASLPTP